MPSFFESWGRVALNSADILLVSFFFYHLLLLIQGTRAVQISVGIVMLAVVTVLARIFGLQSLHWLLQNFWIAGVVFLAVLFQPELRSGLARLGSKTISGISSTKEAQVVNEIIAAVKEASRRQMGMLIAIERDMGLRDFIESGTQIHGDVTTELLLTIFQPPAVLHDGAAIIQGNRLVAAGCILPLSQDATLSKLLGTRHRAAVGLTEVSDAWCVCVSEETGNVSIAHAGKLSAPIDPDALREKMLQLYQSPDLPPKPVGPL